MINASSMAGHLAAKSIWTISDGTPLLPVLAYTKNKERKEEAIDGEDLAEAVQEAMGRLGSGELDADESVLVFEGRIPLEDQKVDAVILELHSSKLPTSKVVIALPYTPKSSGAFKVHKPKIVVWQNCEDLDVDGIMDEFFNGASTHPEGANIWNEALDDTI